MSGDRPLTVSQAKAIARSTPPRPSPPPPPACDCAGLEQVRRLLFALALDAGVELFDHGTHAEARRPVDRG